MDHNPLTTTAPAHIGRPVSLGIGLGVALSLILATEVLPNDVAFAILSTATFAAAGTAIVLAHKNLFNLRRLAIPAVGLMSYTVLIAVPAIFVFLGEIGPSRFRYLLAVHSALLTIPLGVVLTEFVLSSPDRRMSRKADIPNWARFSRLWDLLFLLAVAIVGLHVYQVGFIPATQALSLRGDELAMAVLREESGTLLPGAVNHYLYYWNRILILPGLTILAVGACLAGQKVRWRLRAVCAFCVAVFHGTFTLEKSFSMIPFITVGAFLYLMTRRRIKLGYLLSICIAALSFPLLVYRWIVPESGWWTDVAFVVGRRIFNVPALVTHSYFELVPGQMDFLYGKTSKVIAYVTGSRFFDSANYIYRQEFPNGIDTGTSNACFVGTAWANFGWCGVIVEGLLAGILLQVLWRMIRKRQDVFTTALHALLIIPFTIGFISSPLETLFLTYAVAPAVAGWAILTRFFLLAPPGRAD
jgi:oligosaccharide repeat unit polymerase